MWKRPKGTTDIAGGDYERLQRVARIVEAEFVRNGGCALDTPVFERTDVITANAKRFGTPL